MLRLACLATLCAPMLAACMIPLDERVFFYPPAVEQKATDPADMQLWHQDWITGPFADENYLAGRAPHLEGRLPATVTHDLRSFGGERIAITRVKSKNGAADEPLIVHCGGNATDRFGMGGYYSDKVLPWGEALIFDYPGYGDSTGSPSVATFNKVLGEMAPWLDQIA